MMMRAVILSLAVCSTLATANLAMAQTYHEPARGSAERSGLLDAIRPHAEWLLGSPVEFVVDEMRVSGDIGFAMLSAQRPGGGQIDYRRTPGFARGEFEPDLGDPLQFQVLYKKSGDTWVAVHWGHNSTDVWFSYAPLCDAYYPVIAEYCQF